MINRETIASTSRNYSHYSVYALLLALLLVACSSGEEPEAGAAEAGEGPALGFSASFAEVGSAVGGSRATTRAVGDGELTTDMLKELGFGVYCWYTGSTPVAFSFIPESKDEKCTTPTNHISTYVGENGFMLMRNQKVEWKQWNGETTESWNYTPSKYWPLDRSELLTFRAYAPYANYLTLDSKGMPQLPVVVSAEDYHAGKQYDPLWGTGALLGEDITHEPPSSYMPKDCRYGDLYNNITYAMSGDKRSESDDHDGTIHWFFHHGMSKIRFAVSIVKDPGCDKVVIRGISIKPLYDQGLLDISSPTANEDEKPYWTERNGNMTVHLKEENLPDHTPSDLKESPWPEPTDPGYNPAPFVIKTSTEAATDYYPVLPSGLLIIPREYTTLDKMTITIYYSIDDETETLEAEGTLPIKGASDPVTFHGNTAYTLNLALEPSTKGLDITLVQSAFTPWIDSGLTPGEYEVYNW